MGYRKILAGVDESPAGAHALRAGDEIATAAGAGAELIVLRVVDDPWPFIAPGEVEVKRAMRDGSWRVAAAEQVGEELRRLLASAGLGTIRTRTAVRFGIPGVEIARGAELDDVDLVVLGRQPSSSHERRPTGRTIDGTLRRARVPCLIVPFGWRTWRRVLVLADGVAAGDILERAFAFAETLGSEVKLIEVERQLALAEAGGRETVARKAFAVWARSRRAGTFDVLAREGDAAAEMLKAAREQSADLLVIGYHQGESAEGPSVAARIVQGAPCAVLTVPV